MREQRLLIGNAVVHMAKLRAMAEPGVAAFLLFRSLFQHQYLGAGSMSCHRGGLSGIAESDDDDMSPPPGGRKERPHVGRLMKGTR